MKQVDFKSEDSWYVLSTILCILLLIFGGILSSEMSDSIWSKLCFIFSFIFFIIPILFTNLLPERKIGLYGVKLSDGNLELQKQSSADYAFVQADYVFEPIPFEKSISHRHLATVISKDSYEMDYDFKIEGFHVKDQEDEKEVYSFLKKHQNTIHEIPTHEENFKEQLLIASQKIEALLKEEAKNYEQKQLLIHLPFLLETARKKLENDFSFKIHICKS